MKKFIAILFGTFLASIIYGENTLSYRINIINEDQLPMHRYETITSAKIQNAQLQLSEVPEIDGKSITYSNVNRELIDYKLTSFRMPIGFKSEYLLLSCYTSDKNIETPVSIVNSNISSLLFSTGSNKYPLPVTSKYIIPISSIVEGLNAKDGDSIQVDILDNNNPIVLVATLYFHYWETEDAFLKDIGKTAIYSIYTKMMINKEEKNILLSNNRYNINGKIIDLLEVSKIYIQATVAEPSTEKIFVIPIEYTRLSTVNISSDTTSLLKCDNSIFYYDQPCLVSSFSGKLSCNDIVTVLATNNDQTTINRYFRYRKPVEFYSAVNSNTFGLYAPLNLYSISPTDSGLVIAALPIGLGWGGKLWDDLGYIGISAIASWEIYTKTTVNESDSSINKEWVLPSGFLGGRIDINDLFSVGCGYSFSFVADKSNLGLTFFGSIGAGVLKLLQK